MWRVLHTYANTVEYAFANTTGREEEITHLHNYYRMHICQQYWEGGEDYILHTI